MRIKLTSVFVDDQESALKFYTDVLGFKKKQDSPVGQFKWLTVVSPEEPDGPELLLEPNDNPAAESYQESIYKQGIAAAAFAVNDIQREYARLKELGVGFKMEPTDMGSARIALFDRDLLDLSRLRSGKLVLNKETVSLMVVVNNAIDTVRGDAETKGLSIEVVASDVALFVEGDPLRLEQIVWNLLNNSVKFTPTGTYAFHPN